MQALALVIPCYNEEHRLQKEVLINWVKEHPKVHVYLVNDGSSDRTADMIEALHQTHPDFIYALQQEQNGGKAEAVRRGMLHAEANGTYDYIGYWDADFSAPLSEIDWMLQFCDGTFQHTFILGTRLARLGSYIRRKFTRHLLGRLFSSVTSMVLGLTVYDTQCGAKWVKSEEVPDLFGEKFVSKWLFDVEILARLIQKYDRSYVYHHALEIPLKNWSEIKGSKLKVKDFIKAPLELWAIKKKYGL